MSIREEIEDACGRGDLFYLEPEYEGAGVRHIFVSRSIWQTAQRPFSDDEFGELHEGMRATLDHFSMGGFLSVRWDPSSKKGRPVLARLDPTTSDCWDFRCLEPKPGMRVVGHFSEADVFVALAWEYRDNLKTGTEWKIQVGAVRAEWNRLFSYAPHTGNQLSDFVTRDFEIC